MKTQNVGVVSIQPDANQALAVDVKDVLGALVPCLPQWAWCVRNLDWLGSASAEAFCDMVDAAGPRGAWLTSAELLELAGGVYQTIEGEFWAFPAGIERDNVLLQEVSLRGFPESRAELAIVVVEGGPIEVLAKDADLLSSLKALGNVREENADDYF